MRTSANADAIAGQNEAEDLPSPIAQQPESAGPAGDQEARRNGWASFDAEFARAWQFLDRSFQFFEEARVGRRKRRQCAIPAHQEIMRARAVHMFGRGHGATPAGASESGVDI